MGFLRGNGGGGTGRGPFVLDFLRGGGAGGTGRVSFVLDFSGKGDGTPTGLRLGRVPEFRFRAYLSGRGRGAPGGG